MKRIPLTGLHAKAALGALAASIALLAASAASAASPFAGLDGRWSGSGHASFEGGQRESLRCNATYRTGGGGSSLTMNLRCASASATIHLQGNLHASGNRVSGSWSESTYGVGGDASGSASGGSMRLRFSGSTAGSMAVSLGRSSQSVSISARGSALRSVNVGLSRR